MYFFNKLKLKSIFLSLMSTHDALILLLTLVNYVCFQITFHDVILIETFIYEKLNIQTQTHSVAHFVPQSRRCNHTVDD